MKNYKTITKNVYRVDKPIKKGATPCTCYRFGEDNCEATCLNRRLNIECDSCDFQENCKNKRIQQSDCPNLIVATALKKGNGLFANENIEKHRFITEYVGEVINNEQLVERHAKYTRLGKEHWYVMSVWNSLYIDATEMGNDSRYINHSCEPNCNVEFWQISGINRVGIFAIRDIKIGEELTYNYRAEFYGYLSNYYHFCTISNNNHHNRDIQQCLCGAKACAGTIGEKKPLTNIENDEQQIIANEETPTIEQPGRSSNITKRGRKPKHIWRRHVNISMDARRGAMSREQMKKRQLRFEYLEKCKNNKK